MKVFGTGFYNFQDGMTHGFGRMINEKEAEVVFLEYRRIPIGDKHYKSKDAEVSDKVAKAVSKRFKDELKGRESEYMIADSDNAYKLKKKVYRRINVWLKRLIPHFPPDVTIPHI
jgi:hypothetical protein